MITLETSLYKMPPISVLLRQSKLTHLGQPFKPD